MSIANLLYILTYMLFWAILARSLMSWIFPMGSNNPIVTVLYNVTEPILAPLRRIVPRFGMMDFTPMVAILLLTILLRALSGLS